MKIFVSCLLLLAATTASAQEFTTLAVVRELDEIAVPAQRDGVIATMTIRRGHSVRASEIVAQQDQTDINLRLKVALAELKQVEAKARNNGPVQSASAAVKRARVESELLTELGENAVYLERFRMQNTLERSSADLETAKNELQQQQLAIAIKQGQVKLLQNDLKKTVVRSPVTGTVRKLNKRQGEWVRQGEAVATVTRMDVLVVEGFLKANGVSPHEVTGASATVAIQVAGSPPALFKGVVVEHPAPRLELDGKFPVWVEIRNRVVVDKRGDQRWLIRPGMNGRMTVKLR